MNKNKNIAALEDLAVNVLSLALTTLDIKTCPIYPIREIDTMGWDRGAYTEMETAPSSDCNITLRFAQDVQTGNVYVSANSQCHDFGVVDMKEVSVADVVLGLKRAIDELGLPTTKSKNEK